MEQSKTHIFNENGNYTFCGMHEVHVGSIGNLAYTTGFDIEDYLKKNYEGKYRKLVCKKCINAVKKLNLESTKNEKNKI